MKIAVVGAGLSGLAFSWHYKKLNPSHNVVLYDPLGPKEKTSSLANLLYPFVGMRSKLNWQGFEALLESESLLKEAAKFSDVSIYKKTPLLKIPKNEKEREAFYFAAQNYSKLSWLEKTPFKKPGLWMDSMIQVEGPLYLEALEKACVSLGIESKRELFTKEKEENYDRILIASGYHSNPFFKGELAYLKGQALILKWPPRDFKLPHCLIYKGLHLIPSIDSKSLYIGNTFEREFENFEPDLEKAKALLWSKLKSLFPSIDEGLIIGVKAGVRLTAPSRLPKIGKVNEKKWIFTALGSKGLLYHSYLGKRLARALSENSIESIPPKVLFNKVESLKPLN